MISETVYDPKNFHNCCEELMENWSNKLNKVFVLRSKYAHSDVKNFYSQNFKYIGKPFFLAEDATKDRHEKPVGSIWSEVRNDNSIPNAYRHSTEAQPLHTDGSYIPNFPSSTLMACVRNNVKGGETTFIDSILVYEILESVDPSLLRNLLENDFIHERSGFTKKQRVMIDSNNNIYLNWNFYCLSQVLSNNQKKIAKEFYTFLNQSAEINSAKMSVILRPGDSVFWRDNLCLHGRNSFFAEQKSDRFLWKCAIDIGSSIESEI